MHYARALQRRLGLTNLKPAPFMVRMANQNKVRPDGILRHLRVSIHGVEFELTFIVLDMQGEDGYELLLGRTWLRGASAKQDWGADTITFDGPLGPVTAPVCPRRPPPPSKRPQAIEELDYVQGFTDDDERVFLDANPDVHAIATVDLRQAFRQLVDCQATA